MDELRELYQEVILDHNNNPKNFRQIEHPTHSAEGYNPLCGDQINIFLTVNDDVIEDVSFSGSGCAISKASASLMTAVLKSKTIQEARELFEKFQHMITQKPGAEVNMEELDKLAVFAGVREFPVRVKCASLAWHTLLAALKNKDNVVSTE